MERNCRVHPLVGAVKEEIKDIECEDKQEGRTWSTTLTRSRQKSKSWFGETVRGRPDAGLKTEEEASSSKQPACLWGQAPWFEDRSSYLIAQLVGSSFRVLRMESIIDLFADWVTFQDLLKLHALSSTASCSLTIRFAEQILDSMDDHNRAVMRDEWADFLFGSVGKMVNDYPGVGGGQPASEARHHGLRWDQIRWCVTEDLSGGLIGM